MRKELLVEFVEAFPVRGGELIDGIDVVFFDESLAVEGGNEDADFFGIIQKDRNIGAAVQGGFGGGVGAQFPAVAFFAQGAELGFADGMEKLLERVLFHGKIFQFRAGHGDNRAEGDFVAKMLVSLLGHIG